MNEIKKLNVNGTEYSLSTDVVEGRLISGSFYKEERVVADYVEIGGLKWATKNVGATDVIDTGLYFQWGDTQGYTASQVGTDKQFTWNDYKYTNDNGSTMTKYNETDRKTVLDLNDDGVRANWGGKWRMPTAGEFEALGNATSSGWTSSYEGSGVAGLVFISKTDNSKKLFFSADGYAGDSGVYLVGSCGRYWSRWLDHINVLNAYCTELRSSGVSWSSNLNRSRGLSLRGVWDGEDTPTIPEYNTQITPEQNKLYIDTTTNRIYRYSGSSYVEIGDYNKITNQLKKLNTDVSKLSSKIDNIQTGYNISTIPVKTGRLLLGNDIYTKVFKSSLFSSTDLVFDLTQFGVPIEVRETSHPNFDLRCDFYENSFHDSQTGQVLYLSDHSEIIICKYQNEVIGISLNIDGTYYLIAHIVLEQSQGEIEIYLQNGDTQTILLENCYILIDESGSVIRKNPNSEYKGTIISEAPSTFDFSSIHTKYIISCNCIGGGNMKLAPLKRNDSTNTWEFEEELDFNAKYAVIEYVDSLQDKGYGGY